MCPKLSYVFPLLSSSSQNLLLTFTFILVSVGGTTIQKFTSYIGLLPSLSPTFNQPSSLASFSSSILPNPPFVMVLLTQTISTTFWLFFLPPGVHSPQSNVSKMQIWPRHFSAWILSAVTILFKLSSGLKSSHDLSLPCSSLYLTLELQQNDFRSLSRPWWFIFCILLLSFSVPPHLSFPG